ncbi:endonuclease/exonuclease/phosphatase family protein [Ilumatobacter sp.]|uniref:endonuclease/exonuclease/phosphatase family protein n=1 Tax=Ilumatobacter sp. TaxID=1967498 RepID=UPI003AF812A3
MVAVAQVTRVLFPIMFEIGEDWDFLLAGLVALGTFSTPMLAVLALRLRPPHAVVAGATTIGVALLVLRLVHPIPPWLAIVAVAAALVGATVIVARSSLGSQGRVGPLVSALVVGLAVDAAIRALFDSWDLVWQQSAVSLVVVIVIAGTLVATAVVAGRNEPGSVAPVSSTVWMRLGAYMMLQLVFLQNFGFVGSQAAIGYVPAVLTVLVANLVALAGVRVVPHLTVGVTIGVAIATVGVAWAVSLVTGFAIVVLVIVLQAGLTLFVVDAASLAPHREPGLRTIVLGVTGGSVLFLVLVLLWSLHIDQPLPFPRQVLPAVAALLVVSAAVPAGLAVAPVARPSRLGVATVGVLVVVVPVVLVVAEPGTQLVTADSEVRLVDYNVRGSVNTDGQLAPDQVVAEIRSSDPDVVVLQEVARGWPIHGTMDLLAYLERSLGMAYRYVPAADGQFGNAILSRLPITEVDSGSLPNDGVQERGYAIVLIEVPGDDLTVAVAHTHSRSAVQVAALLEAVDADSRLVIAGDMNIAPDDPEVAMFTDAGLIDTVGATGDPCRTTSAEPTSGCDRPDWVFITPDIDIDNLRIGTGGASDHLPIHVTLQM